MGWRVVFLFCFVFLQPSYVNVARRLRAVITLCNTSGCTRLDNTQDGANRWAVCTEQEPKKGAPSTTVASHMVRPSHSRNVTRESKRGHEHFDGLVDPALHLGRASSEVTR
jgi:hypothetical protein